MFLTVQYFRTTYIKPSKGRIIGSLSQHRILWITESSNFQLLHSRLKPHHPTLQNAQTHSPPLLFSPYSFLSSHLHRNNGLPSHSSLWHPQRRAPTSQPHTNSLQEGPEKVSVKASPKPTETGGYLGSWIGTCAAFFSKPRCDPKSRVFFATDKVGKKLKNGGWEAKP